MTVSEALKHGKDCLKKAEIESYSIDSELLLMKALGFGKTELFTKDDYLLTDEEFDKFNSFLKRREKAEPIAYIIGRQEFMGLEFKVNEFTLIPRPDTEVLVEKVIEEVKKHSFKTFLDIGTGSGAIAVSVLKYIDDVRFDAVDISEEAIKKAQENAVLNNVADRINFIKSNIYENIINKKYDVIVSNPPYIRTDVIEDLEKNVKDYEPFSALDGGCDGLYFYREITQGAVSRLNENGMLFFEIGYDQGEEVSLIMSNLGFKEICVLKDLAGLDRVVFGCL